MLHVLQGVYVLKDLKDQPHHILLKSSQLCIYFLAQLIIHSDDKLIEESAEMDLAQ